MGRGSLVHISIVLAILVLGAIAHPPSASGQNNRFTERSFVSSPIALGMGDAGVVLPDAENPFFYNPALLPLTASHFTILGVQGASSRSLPDQISFFNNRVQPAVRSEFDVSTGALARLNESAYGLANRPGRGHGAVLLPSFVYTPGALSVGAGLYSKTALNYRIEDGAGHIPSVWLLSRTDVMAVASMGLSLRVVGVPQVSVGLTGSQTRRFLAFKNAPLDRIREPEPAVLLEGSTFQMDLGVVYTPRWFSSVPGTVRVGGAAYDILMNGYAYTKGGRAGRLPFLDGIVGPSESGDVAPLPREWQRARRSFSLKPSYRVGMVYQVPSVSFLDDVAVAVDYQGYRSGEQVPLARLHLGARAEVVGPLRVRAGLSSGYPSGGIGARLGALEVDYSLHGEEEGRQPGQLVTYVHTARLLLRLK